MTSIQQNDPNIHEEIERVLVMGDLARLTPQQRNEYYKRTCESLGLNPLTRPFEFIVLNGKLQMYARKDAADQLRAIHGVSIRIVERTVMDDLMVVTAEATDRKGRIDSSIGAVSIAGLRGEAKANALMKAETKARRRVTLAICGLGILDESEIDSTETAPAEPRAADRLLSAPPSAPVQSKSPAQAATNPPKPKDEEPRADAAPENGDDTEDIEAISEHKSRNGKPVWKVTAASGAVYATDDPLVVEDLSGFRADGRSVRIAWVANGARRVIQQYTGVAE
jgi:hypothetical protein